MVGIEVLGRVMVITLQRPEERNAIDRSMTDGMERALDRLEYDSEIWVGVLAAEGTVFCAGVDLEAVASGEGGVSTERGGFAGLTLRERAKPLIAAVDGPALAGGFELVLACDLVVASVHAVFGLPEVRRSLVAGAGALFRLPRSIGEKLALEILLTGDPVSAERLHRAGLVNQLVEPGAARAGALALAQRIAANAPLAVQESLRVARRALGEPEASLWAETARSARRVVDSEDFAEGPRAFVQRRTPVWRGR
ncbi:MAG: crotonase/enoyl-CoA hydratase family protein [Acidimicrobiales bacterium]